MVALYNFIFFEDFESILLVVFLLDDKQDLAVGALADDALGDEVLARDLAGLVLLLLNDVLVVLDLVLTLLHMC